ncbi:MAG: hypothetical protein EXR98_14480 [Gemmataceae bacterium]|nr:hypothetical protein [Gemmataceae bacterium]
MPKMTVSRDPSAKSVTLILPDNLVTALQPAVLPRVASTGSATMVGLALVGSLVAGGLWLARLPRAKYLVGVMIPLLGLALVNSVVQAQSARLDPPRAVVETGKVRISRGSPGQIQLILPARAPAK